MRIVIDNNIPYIKGVFEPYAEVVYAPATDITPKLVKYADALVIRTRTKCNRELLEGSSVRFIASATIGFDHIDAEYCNRSGIVWRNAPGCNASSVMQYVLSALLTLHVLHGVGVFQKTIGIIGVGNVGSKIKAMADLLGMNVLLNDPLREAKEGKQQFCSLNTMLPQADFVSLHVPLTRNGEYATQGMAAKMLFEQLKKGAVLINTSRGEVINEKDLLNALSKGSILHTVFDVWNNEPNINTDLLKQTTIATPHIAGYSADGKAMASKMSAEALADFFSLPIKYQLTDFLPIPANPFIKINCAPLSPIAALHEAIKITYDIMCDDNSLRKNPLYFERLRSSYYVRREPLAYKIVLENSTTEHQKLVNKFFPSSF